MRMIVTGTEGRGVNVREQPDASSRRVGGLEEGATVDAGDHAWRRVKTGVLSGWVAAEYLDEAPADAPSEPAGHFTARQVAEVLGAPQANVERHLPGIYAALDELGIGDRATTIAALATIGVETGAFLPVREAFWLSEDWRKANFRYWPYYGRGFIQITWQSNYQHYGDLLGEDLVNNPDLALDPTIAARVLALYFKEHDIPRLAAIPDWFKIRVAINGGTNGWQRFADFVDALEALPS